MNVPVVNWMIQRMPLDGGISQQISSIRIKYNNTDFSYLTSKPGYSDMGAFVSGAGVIDVLTILPNLGGDAVTPEANTGLDYDPESDNFIVVSNYDRKAYFYTRASILAASAAAAGTKPTPVRSISIASNQDVAVDPIGRRLFDTSFSGTARIYDLDSGVQVDSITALDASTIFYDYETDILYATKSPIETINRWEKDGTWGQLSDLWQRALEGVSLNWINRKIVFGTGGNLELISESWLQSDLDGYNVSQFIPATTTSKQYSEGIFVDVDGTLWYNSDEYFHGAVNNGNRLIHVDAQKTYKKFVNFPQMIPFTSFKGLSKSQDYLSEKISGSSFALSPVLDMKSFTDWQNISQFTFPDNVDVEFRSSAVAPSLSLTTPLACDVEYVDANLSNDGWGSTTPSAWSTSVPTQRYIQFKVTTKVPTTVETIDDILGSDLLYHFEMHKVDNMWTDYINTFAVPKVGQVLNIKDITNNFTQSVINSRPQWVIASNYLNIDATAANKWLVLQSPTEILNLTECEIHVVTRREGATRQNYIFNAASSGAVNNRLLCRHLPSSDGTNPNFMCIEYTSSGGTVNRIGFTDTGGQTFRLITFKLGGASNKIYVNGVEQVLTVASGANSGWCFDDLAVGKDSITMGRVLSSSQLQGFTYAKMCMVTRPLTDAQRAEILAYVQSEGMI